MNLEAIRPRGIAKNAGERLQHLQSLPDTSPTPNKDFDGLTDEDFRADRKDIYKKLPFFQKLYYRFRNIFIEPTNLSEAKFSKIAREHEVKRDSKSSVHA